MTADVRGASSRTELRRAAVLAVVMTAVIWLGALLPDPWGALDRRLLQAVRWQAPAVAVLLSVAWAVLVGAVRWRHAPESDAAAEEPLLSQPHMVPCRAAVPVVVMVGVEPKAGVSTIAFNLAVFVAIFGLAPDDEAFHAPRPACLLAEGALTDALRLSPIPLDDYLSQHRHVITSDVVNTSVRHPSGAELFCLKYGGNALERLPSLVSELRRHYDAVLVDGGQGSRQLLDLTIDRADALLVVSRPTEASEAAAAFWTERTWELGLEGRAGLLLNRVVPRPVPSRKFASALLYFASLPEDPRVPFLDANGLPWSLDGELLIADAFARLARQLFPTLIVPEGANAA